MGGLVGIWGRIHEDRKRRQVLTVSLRDQRIFTPRVTAWQETVGVPKRRCAVHHRLDRCWRRQKQER